MKRFFVFQRGLSGFRKGPTLVNLGSLSINTLRFSPFSPFQTSCSVHITVRVIFVKDVPRFIKQKPYAGTWGQTFLRTSGVAFGIYWKVLFSPRGTSTGF